MGNCKIDNYSTEYVVNTLKNKENLYNVYDLSTNIGVKNAIESVGTKFKKESKEDNVFTYYVKNTLSRVSQTFTQKNNPSKKANFNEKNRSTLFGDAVHAYMYEYVTLIHEKKSTASLDKKYTNGINDFQFTSAHLRVMKETGDAILLEAQLEQDRINEQTGNNDKFVIIAEQAIIDGPRDLGGTPDLIVIFSNNNAVVYDYKTSGNDKTYSKSIHKYLGQLRDIKHTLNTQLGVNVVNSKLVNFRIAFKDKEGTANGNKINKFGLNSLQREGAKTKFANGEYALLGIKGVDDWIKKQYEYLHTLETAIRKQKDKVKKDELRDKRYKLQETIQNFIYQYEYDVLNDYIQNTVIPELNHFLNSKLNVDLYSELTNEEAMELVNRQLEEVSMLINLLDTHKNILPNSKELDIQDTINNLKQGFEELSAKRIELFLDNTDIDIQEGEPVVFKAKKINQFQRLMKRFSTFAHPILEALFDIHINLDNEAKLKMNKFSDKMYNLAIKLESELKKESKTFKELFINSSGNYISEISEEGFALIKDYKKDNKIEEAKQDIYDIKEEEFNEWYKKASTRQKAKLEKELTDLKDENEAMYNQTLENRFLEWDKKYNILVHPEVYFSDFGRKFLKYKETFKKNYMSSEFKIIQNNQIFVDYWNFIHETNNEVRELLGMDYKDIPNNFFPNVKKEIAEGFTMDMAGVKNTYQQVVESFSLNETDVIGKTGNRIPIMFISKLSKEEKSFDYAKSMTLFYNMALNYERAKTLEAYANTAQDLMKYTEIQEQDTKGNPVLDWMKNKTVNKAGSVSVEEYKKVLETFIQKEVYGQQMDDTLPPKLTKLINSFNKFGRVTMLGLKLNTAIGSGLAANIARILEAKKGIIVKEGDFADYWKSRKSIKGSEEWNIFRDAFSPIDDNNEQSLLFMGKGLARKILSDRVMLAAYRKGDELQQDLLGWGMAKNFGIDAAGNVKLLSKLPEGSKSLFELLKYKNDEKGLEIWFEGYTSEDSLKKIMSFRTKVRNAYFNIAGTIDSTDTMAWQQNIILRSLMMFKSWMPGTISERIGQTSYNNTLEIANIPRYNALLNYLKNPEGKTFTSNLGYLSKKSGQLLLDSISFGKLNWVYGNQPELDGVKAQKINLQMAKARYGQFIAKNPKADVTFEEFVNTYEGQLKAISAELRTIILFMAVLMLLGSDDDEMIYSKDNNMFSRFAYKSILKAKSEILYWYNPTELLNLADNPLPALNTVSTVISAFTNGVDELRDGIIGENSLQDRSNVGYYSTKLIRGLNGVRSIYSWYDQENSK